MVPRETFARSMAEDDRRQKVLADYRKTLLAHKETDGKVRKSELHAPLPLWRPLAPHASQCALLSTACDTVCLTVPVRASPQCATI